MKDILKLCEEYNQEVEEYSEDSVVLKDGTEFKFDGYKYKAIYHFICYDYVNKKSFLKKTKRIISENIHKRDILCNLMPKLTLDVKIHNNSIIKYPYLEISKDYFIFKLSISDDKVMFSNDGLKLPYKTVISDVVADFITDYFNLCYERRKVISEIRKLKYTFPSLQQMEVDSKLSKLLK